jgi:colicin import membrane protein
MVGDAVGFLNFLADSVRQLACEDRAGRVIEQANDGGVTELLLDPGQAGRGLLDVPDLVCVGGDRGGEADLEQVTRLLGLAAAVEASDGTQIDHERADPAQRPRQLVVAPERVIALGVREHGHLAGTGQIEQLVGHAYRQERRRDLDKEGGGVLVAGHGAIADPAVEHIIPHVLRAEPQRRVMRAPGDTEPGKRGLDGIPGWQVLRSLLVRRDTLLGYPERRQSIEHRERRRLIGSTVVEPVEHVAMEVDEAHRLMGIVQGDRHRRRVRHRCAKTSPGNIALLRRITRDTDRGVRGTGPVQGICMATQPEKRENSVLFSLRELRQIEENRVQEEENAIRTAEEQRVRAQQEAERRRREEEETRVRAERDAQLELERARENAEREARMRVEAAEAAERQRQQALLEQQRLQQEMELRRAEVAKKRPTWMLAVTFLALVGVVVAIVLVVKFQSSEQDSKEKELVAQRERDEAVKAAREAQEKVDQLEREATDMIGKINGAIGAVDAAQNDADRASAKARLAQLQRDQAEMQARIAKAKAEAARAQRLKGAKISAECQANPLAKGCGI